MRYAPTTSTPPRPPRPPPPGPTPPLNKDGYYEGTPSEIVKALLGGSSLRWTGAPVQTTAVVRKLVGAAEADVRGITQGRALVFFEPQGDSRVEVLCEIVPPPHVKEGDLALVRGQIIALYQPAQLVLLCEAIEPLRAAAPKRE